MRVEYDSNNSGGSWWLKESDWLALEKAGWIVEWGGKYFCHSPYRMSGEKRDPSKGEPCAVGDACPGHLCFDSYEDAKAAGASFLGALAQKASLECGSIGDAIRSFEAATGADASDEGCNCCGAPHSFSTREPYAYASGEEVLPYLYPDRKIPKSLREAMDSHA